MLNYAQILPHVWIDLFFLDSPEYEYIRTGMYKYEYTIWIAGWNLWFV